LLGHQDYLLKTGTLRGKSVWMGALPVMYNLVQSYCISEDSLSPESSLYLNALLSVYQIAWCHRNLNCG